MPNSEAKFMEEFIKFNTMNMREHVNQNKNMHSVSPSAAKLSFGKAVNAGICIKQSANNLIMKTMQAKKEFKA
jgi:hypothetical protein